jgi:hypothetical protein
MQRQPRSNALVTAARSRLRRPVRNGWLTLAAALVPLAAAPSVGWSQSAPPAAPAQPTQPAKAEASKPAESGVVDVTVYQGTALVTREVKVPAGGGLTELVVGPLPPSTLDTSLYTEGTDGIRVLTTRYRSRAVREDTREEVRKRESQIQDLNFDRQKIEREIQSTQQNLQTVDKLEQFTAATMQQLAEKGQLNAEATLQLAKYVMDQRNTLAQQVVAAQRRIEDINRQVEFLQRELAQIAAGSNRTEREAVIVLEKLDANAGTVRLNYLVSNASWRPTYKLRSANENQPVQVEYLASVEQQSGEDWGNVTMTLSTAQPMLNAAPPDLLALNVDVRSAREDAQAAANAPAAAKKAAEDNVQRARQLRQQAQTAFNSNNFDVGNGGINDAAAAAQYADVLSGEFRAGDKRDADDRFASSVATIEGPSVTYRLKNRMSVPTRPDQQLVEIARLELPGEYTYKTVPVLSPHVYRLAELTNKSEMVLLAGDANVYFGQDFVGRMALPLVAVGEKFVAGFGVDPQVQVERELVAKNRAIQGGNQVHTFDYRIRVSSFKSNAIKLQVWDRLPLGENENVGVNLVSTTPALSNDATYVRQDRPKNLLRWDLTIEPGTTGEKANVVSYQYKLEYDRSVAITDFKSRR